MVKLTSEFQAAHAKCYADEHACFHEMDNVQYFDYELDYVTLGFWTSCKCLLCLECESTRNNVVSRFDGDVDTINTLC